MYDRPPSLVDRIDAAPLPMAEGATLVALVRHTDAEGACWPSVDRLADHVAIGDAVRSGRPLRQGRATDPLPDVADVAAFAGAIARDGGRALLLADDGGHKCRAGWTSIDGAVATGRAFAVEAADRLLAVDVDDPGSAAVDTLREAAAAAGVATVEVASGRPGHRHLYAVVGDVAGELRAEVDAAVRALGVDVRRGGARIRPPLSPHPAGFPVGLVAPDGVDHALAELAGPDPGTAAVRALLARLPEPHVTSLPSGSGRGRGLPAWARILLSELPADGDRSRALARLALSMVDRGWGDDAIVVALLASPSGDKAREKRDPGGWLLRHIVGQARTHAAVSPPTSDLGSRLEEIARHRAATAGVTWPTATRGKVIGAMQALAEGQGGGRFRASEREAAEAASCHRATVTRHLDALMAAGWLRRVRRATGTRAALWLLTVPADGQLCATTVPRGGVGGSGAKVSASHDAARWAATGASWATFAVLDPSEPLTVSNVAETIGRTARTARRHLAKLDALGLAVADDTGWLRVTDDALPAALDTAAKQAGTAGKGREQAARHRLERRAWQAHVGRARAEHALARMPTIHRDPATGERWIVDPETGELLPVGGLDPLRIAHTADDDATGGAG